MTEESKLIKGQKLAEKAAILETILAGSKAIVGLASGSMALISDAVHSGSDLLTIFTSWLGLKIAQKKPDKNFPYGYYKAENIGTLIISLFIFFAAGKMLTEAYSRLFSFSSVKLPLLALAVSLTDAIILFFFGKYEIKIGRQVNSQSLIAMGSENRTHLFSSTAVFIGTLAAYFHIPYLEGIVILLISFLIIQIGLSSIKQALFSLMDVSPGKEIEDQVGSIIENILGVEDFFDLRLRKTGPFVSGQVKIAVRKSINVNQSHQISDKIETDIKNKVPTISSFDVHVEPFQTDFRHLVIPVKEKAGLSSKLAKRFGQAPYFLFINLKADKIKGFYFLANPYKKQTTKIGLSIAKLIMKQKSDILITSKIGEIASNSLHSYFIDIYQSQGQTAQQAINYFIKGDLILLNTSSAL